MADQGKPDQGKPDQGKPDQGKPDQGKPDSKSEKGPIKQSPEVLRKAPSSVETDQSESGKQNKIEHFEQEYEKYVVIKDLLKAPSQEHHIQQKIYNFKYAKKRTDKNIQRLEDNVQLVQSALKHDPPSATETRIDQATVDCGTLRGLAPEVRTDELMNRKRLSFFICITVLVIVILCVIFVYWGSPSTGIATVAQVVVVFATAIMSIETFTVNLEKDVISSLTKKQKNSIKSSQNYLSHLLNHRLTEATSIIILLVAAIVALIK